MKARVEVVIRDEEGKILGQLDSYSMELGAQSLYEIEGAVEDWRQKVPGYDSRITAQCPNQIYSRVKKTVN